MSEREAAVRKQIMRLIQSLDGAKAVPYVACQGSEVGTPDIIGCYQGRMFALEVKRPGGKPSPIQVKRIEEWQAAGAIAGVVESVTQASVLLGRALDG